MNEANLGFRSISTGCDETLSSVVNGVFGGGQEAAGRDTARAATRDEVKGLRVEAQLKELLAEVLLENRLLKKV